MTVNDHPLRITSNLRDFLEILQADVKQRERWFWADQISMNQQDVNERDHQVTMRGSIYDAASNVYAYIGPQLENHEPGHKLFTYTSDDPDDHYQDVAIALHALTAAYWLRLWIVQELYLATEIMVYHGSYAVDATVILAALQKLNDHVKSSSHKVCCNACEGREQLFKRKFYARIADLLSSAWLAAGRKNATKVRNDLKSLGSVLNSYFTSECSELRDKIFGLQALVVPSQRMAIDYTRSYDDICLEVLRTLIASEESNDRAPMALDTVANKAHSVDI